MGRQPECVKTPEGLEEQGTIDRESKEKTGDSVLGA